MNGTASLAKNCCSRKQTWSPLPPVALWGSLLLPWELHGRVLRGSQLHPCDQGPSILASVSFTNRLWLLVSPNSELLLRAHEGICRPALLPRTCRESSGNPSRGRWLISSTASSPRLSLSRSLLSFSAPFTYTHTPHSMLLLHSHVSVRHQTPKSQPQETGLFKRPLSILHLQEEAALLQDCHRVLQRDLVGDPAPYPLHKPSSSQPLMLKFPRGVWRSRFKFHIYSMLVPWTKLKDTFICTFLHTSIFHFILYCTWTALGFKEFNSGTPLSD